MQQKNKTMRTKYSGVEWIGDIPVDWEMRKVVRIFDTISSGTTPNTGNRKFYDNGTIKWVNTGDLNDGYLNDCAKVITSLAIQMNPTLKVYPKNSLIIALYGATIGKLGILNFEATVNQACCVMSNTEVADVKFVYYWFLASKKYIIQMSYGGGQPNISQDIVKSLKIPLPNLNVQRKIAKYLDVKTEQIKDFIDDKNKLIALLREQKRTVILEAVTGGINKKVKTKSSDVEWFGDIPDHWKTAKVKQIVTMKVTDGPHETPNFVPDGVPFASAESVFNGKINFEHVRGYITKEQDIIYSAKCKPIKNDIFIVKSGSTTGKIALIEDNVDFNIWSPLALVRVNEKLVFYKFVFYFFTSEAFQKQVQTFWSFGTQPNIGMNVIEKLSLTLPPLQEQKEIVDYIEQKTSVIDQAILTVKKEIKLIEEYRSSLIYQSITGKIEELLTIK